MAAKKNLAGKHLDIATAMAHVAEDLWDDWARDPTQFREFRADRAATEAEIASIDLDEYHAVPIVAVGRSREPFGVRPGGGWMAFRDRVIYQALADRCAEKIEQRIESQGNSVYSVRLDRGGRRFLQSGPRAWVKFQQRVRGRLATKRFKYVVKSDIAGYFHNIGHHELANAAQEWGLSPYLCEVLEIRLLGCWSGPSGPSRGIPQQFDPSAVLANGLLLKIDQMLWSPRREVLRYMDDYFVFCESLLEARRVMLAFWEAANAVHLTPSEVKSTILPVDDAEALLDADVSVLGHIDLGIEFGIKGLAVDALIKAFDANVLLDDFNERHFRKHVNQFRKTGVDYAIDEVLHRLEAMPWAADIFALYLRRYVHRTKVRRRLLGFLRGDYGRMLPWTRSHYIAALEGHSPRLHGECEAFLTQVGCDPNENWLVRSAAVGALARRGTEASCESVQAGFHKSLPPPLQKALIMCASRLPKQTANRMFKRRSGVVNDEDAALRYFRERPIQLRP
ncbi:MAG: RNA-directed DNA polymerase [Dehalococcoidia bacterium]